MDQYLKTSPGLDIQPPLKFLPDYKNPCWYMKKALHCLPTYYILGYPKCATTDIWHKIAQHPQIVEPAQKEIHWWASYRYKGGKESSFRTFYSRSFGKAVSEAGNKESIIGDASPDTTWETRPSYRQISYATRLRSVHDAPRVLPANVIKRYTPKAKFIFMMRNPTDRVYSHHLYEGKPTVQIGKTPEVPRSQNMFHIKVTQIIGQFQDCFQRRSVRACVYDPNLLHEAGEAKVLLQPGLYAVFISDWLKIFPREQFLFINTDDYSHNQESALKTAFEFLDVDIPADDTIEKVIKEAVRPNSRTVNGVAIGPMWNDTRELLDDFYEPFNRALAEILGDDRYLFLKEAPGVEFAPNVIKKKGTKKTKTVS
ncbi:carbohydrate sulfotransferase 15-like [Lineus longissimus]|uniref:carbohydrate sulfotransferase 15-like n=1 Tax=Lineus longissimus TaxID=88925 RepID=UPI00315C8688